MHSVQKQRILRRNDATLDWIVMRRTLEIFVMIRMLLLVTVVGLPAPHRHLKHDIESHEVVSRPETSQYQEYQVHAEKPQLCKGHGSESFVVEPDLLGDLLNHFNPSRS